MKKLKDHLMETYPDRISEINEAYQNPSTDSIRGLLIALGAIKGRPRTMMNGDLVFPVHGQPPKPAPGYIADPNRPFVHHLVYKECPNRYFKDVSSACCKGTKRVYFCKLDDFVTTFIRCEQCETARTDSSSGEITGHNKPRINNLKEIQTGISPLLFSEPNALRVVANLTETLNFI